MLPFWIGMAIIAAIVTAVAIFGPKEPSKIRK